MAYFPFYERPDLLVFTCTHVLDGEAPVSFVAHHFDDGSWEFLCGAVHKSEDAVITGVMELVHLDKSLAKLCDLPVGCCAQRTEDGGWCYSVLPGERIYPGTMDALKKLQKT